MTTTTTELLSDYLDVTKMAVTGYLARYCAPTLTTCTLDLRTFVACLLPVPRPGDASGRPEQSWKGTCGIWSRAGTHRYRRLTVRHHGDVLEVRGGSTS